MTATPLELNSGSGTNSTEGYVGIRIGAPTSNTGHSARDVSAPADAETWAIFYEESQGRFPVLVSRLQGEGAFGCDCLSFAAHENRTAFQAAPHRLDLVARFIEVKSGQVKLTRNEERAARRQKKRYFIYRILLDTNRASAHLTIIENPMHYSTALVQECEVNVSKIEDRKELRLNATI